MPAKGLAGLSFGAPPKSIGINLEALKQQDGIRDFQDDFMDKYDEFSESWREACRKMQRF
jgi:hypothetical protein